MSMISDVFEVSPVSDRTDSSPPSPASSQAARVCLVWVPRSDARQVRRALIQHGFAFTHHAVRSGHWDRPWTQFWLVTDTESVPLLIDLLRRLSPPRTVRYHSPHGWHTDAWLHPTTVTLQGALCTTWAVDTTTVVDRKPVTAGVAPDPSGFPDLSDHSDHSLTF